MSTVIQITIDPAAQAAFANRSKGRGLILQNVAQELTRQVALNAPDYAIEFFAQSGGNAGDFFAFMETRLMSRLRSDYSAEFKLGDAVREIMARRT